MIIFQDPKVLITDKEKVEIAKLRLESGFSTLERELAYLYPNMTKEEIETLEDEIIMERLAANTSQIAMIDRQEDDSEEVA